MRKINDGALDDCAYPVLLLNRDLTFFYANDAAKHRYGILCRKEGVKPFIVSDIYEKTAMQIAEHRSVLLKNHDIVNFTSILLIPVLVGDEFKVLVNAEDERSIYNVVYGTAEEKELSRLFYGLETIPVDMILTLCKGMRQRFRAEKTPELKAYIDKIEQLGNELLQITSNMTTSTRLLTMTEKYGLSYINLNDFYQHFRAFEPRIDISGLETINQRIPFGRERLVRLTEIIIRYLVQYGKGSVFLKSKLSGSHVILDFSTPVSKLKLNLTEAFDIDKGDFSLFFARRVIEQSGGNIMVQLDKKSLKVIVSVRILSPVNYSYYLA